VIIYNQAVEIIEALQTTEFDITFDEFLVELENVLQQIPILSDINLDQGVILETLQIFASSVINWLTSLAVEIAAALPGIFIGVLIFIILVFTLLPAMDNLVDSLEELSPLDADITSLYLSKAVAMITSMVKGVFLLAIIQGLIMGVFYWIAGIPASGFWTFLSIMFAVLPVVGISFIVLPMAIILIFAGNLTSALIVLFGFYVVVNPLDLILRPRLVSKEAYINFVLILLAILGGVYAAGLLGLIYGPVIMILFVTTIDIYRNHFSGTDKSERVINEEIETPDSNDVDTKELNIEPGD
jgi:predicted PurR-regulated permease PerM